MAGNKHATSLKVHALNLTPSVADYYQNLSFLINSGESAFGCIGFFGINFIPQ